MTTVYGAGMTTNDMPRIQLLEAVRRGFSCRCPRCNGTALYIRYLKTEPVCSTCGTALGEIRTDDIAPYFTILLVGHVIVPLLLGVQQFADPPVWVHWMIWPTLTLAGVFLLLPRIKGAVLGWMLWLGLRGDEQH
jgi:uncharacterized protein (DUF983 family)